MLREQGTIDGQKAERWSNGAVFVWTGTCWNQVVGNEAKFVSASSSLYISASHRDQVVGKAKGAIAEAILKLSEAHDLNYGELISILSSELASLAKAHVRSERHPGGSGKLHR